MIRLGSAAGVEVDPDLVSEDVGTTELSVTYSEDAVNPAISTGPGESLTISDAASPPSNAMATARS